MQCPSCGSPLSTGITTCPACNRPVPNETRLNEMPQRPQIFSAMNMTLLAVIVLFLMTGGSGLAYYAQVIHPNDLHAQATVVAQTVLEAQGQSTAQASLQLSATAAALTPQQIYAQATSGTPVINTGVSSGYLFVIGQAGGYGLYLLKTGSTPELSSGTSTAINTGLGQSNLLTVIVRSGKIYMFVNRQPIAHMSDSTYKSGQVALYGQGVNNSTDVAFNNAQVWSL